MTRFQAVICGGGIAGAEALLRLRRLAGDAIDITLVAPNTHLDYRPVAVLEPFDEHPVRRFPLQRITEDAQARWIRGSLGWVERHRHVVHTKDGTTLPFDALLLAVGARRRPTNHYMTTFTSERGDTVFRPLLADIDAGSLRNLAFVFPDGPTWPLPLYELALLTAKHAADRKRSVDISVVTPESAPLSMLGGHVARVLTGLLADAGVTLYCGTRANMPSQGRLLLSNGDELRPQRTITLARLSGPDVQGIPGDAVHRFLQIDDRCRITHTDGRLFAAGDATDCPVKHGAISAQQADTAAAGIVHLSGLGPPSDPLHPIMHAMLVTGHEPLYLSAYIIAGRGWSSRISATAPWSTPGKVAAQELGPYLQNLRTAPVAVAPDFEQNRLPGYTGTMTTGLKG